MACFQSEIDAEQFLVNLKERLEGFQLELAAEKTRRLEFGRPARIAARRRGTKPGEFSFLGFTFYCGKTRQGAFKVKRKTRRETLTAALKDFSGWLRRERNRHRTGVLLRRARSRVQGCYRARSSTVRCARSAAVPEGKKVFGIDIEHVPELRVAAIGIW